MHRRIIMMFIHMFKTPTLHITVIYQKMTSKLVLKLILETYASGKHLAILLQNRPCKLLQVTRRTEIDTNPSLSYSTGAVKFLWWSEFQNWSYFTGKEMEHVFIQQMLLYDVNWPAPARPIPPNVYNLVLSVAYP